MSAVISREQAEALIREQVVPQIFQDVPKQSTFMALARKLPNMTSKQTRIRVLDQLPMAYWGNGSERKQKLSAAGYDYDAVQKKVNELLSDSSTSVSYYPKCSYKGTSIVDALKSIGVDSSYASRTKIAIANGIKGYLGSSSQNTQLLDLLKAGKLVKV